MASENSNFSGATWQSYTPDPISFAHRAGMKFVYFKYKNAYGESDPVWDNISYEPIMYYDISGYVRDELANQDIIVLYVPPNSYSDAPEVESLRIAVFSTHSEEQIQHLVEGIGRAI